MKKILLVDGNSLLFRAYHASAAGRPIMKTSEGLPTNAVFSFANMLLSLINTSDYYDVKVAFDKGKVTFRHDMLENYKAGRAAVPEELIPQFQLVRDFLTSANISWFERDQIEADDLIGSMAKKIESNFDYEVDILSNDKDMYQLISEKTKIVVPVSGTSDMKNIGIEELKEKWNISPEQVIDLKGIMGDSSDNLKGVVGIGEKGAIKLINEFGSLESIYENIDNINGAIQQKLINDKESAFLCKEVATILTDIDFNGDFNIQPLAINDDELFNFFTRYEMRTLAKRFSNTATLVEEKPLEIKILNSWSKDYEALENYIYVETIEANYHKAKINGIGIVNEKGNFFINQEEEIKQLSFFEEFSAKQKDNALESFLNNPNVIKKTYDIKQTVTLLENNGYKVNFDSFTYDMMVACYSLNANAKSNFVTHVRMVDPLSTLKDDEEVYGKGIKRTAVIDIKEKSNYILKKASLIKEYEEPILNQLGQTNQLDLYNKMEFPFIKVLFNMEKNGILINREELKIQTNKILKEIISLEKDMFEILQDNVDESFNFSSPKQINELLFDKLGLPTNKKGSTGKDILESLSALHPIVNLLLEHRKLSKLYSTYLKGFEKYIFDDKKIHTIFNQTLTNTGRLSSTEPNVQNISVRDAKQKEVRKIFIASNDTMFYSFDYSQIELRILAQLSQEKTLLEIFERKQDIHEMTARKIFKLDASSKVDADQRRVAKVFNFGILYGLTDYGLSNDLKISVGEAKKYIADYYESFPDLLAFRGKMVDEALANGYALSITKRRRIIDELNSSNYQVKEFGKRIAINMPIQGSAADVLKVAMINIADKFNKQNLNTKMIAQIHDEIIFEIKNSDVDQSIEIIKSEMQKALNEIYEMFNLTPINMVDLEVSKSCGKTWFDLK